MTETEKPLTVASTTISGKVKTKYESASHYSQAGFKLQPKLVRVSRRARCPICGKPDWCSVAADGTIALCMRVASGSVKTARNGAYVHVLTPSVIRLVSTQSRKDSSIERADASHLDAVYSFMLTECLALSPDHKEKLRNERGLLDTSIEANLYRSVPTYTGMLVVCSELARRFDLSGVPGFFRGEDERWRMAFWHRGIFIPVRDVQGRIVACQSRCDAGETRYLWFSSDGFPAGTSSGAPIHFAKPDYAKCRGFAVITEGALKADIIAQYLQCAVIGLAGVSSFNAETFGQEIQKAMPELRNVVVAFDADWREKKPVKDALLRLIRALKAANLNVKVRVWDGTLGKGFDDYLRQAERRAA
jgi:hypothetical protein